MNSFRRCGTSETSRRHLISMDDETRRSIDSILTTAPPKDLVDRFKSLLAEVGVTIKAGG